MYSVNSATVGRGSGADEPAGDVLAVVVTFNPDRDLIGNLRALRAQAATLVVIDNGSSNSADVKAAAQEAGCLLIENPTNLGIATALNQAARLALEGSFDWLAAFDQDSRIAPGVVTALLELRGRHPDCDRIAVVAPSRRDRSAGQDYHMPFDIQAEGTKWRVVRSTVTSGSLISTDILRRVGFFDDKLFIDAVDHDFCLRCRRQGYLILEGKHQLIDHSLGSVDRRQILGLTMSFTNHSPTRRYYMTRNALEVYSRNLFFDPLWSLRGYAHLLVSTPLALLYENERGAKFRAVIEGVRDFALRRFGPRPASRRKA